MSVLDGIRVYCSLFDCQSSKIKQSLCLSSLVYNSWVIFLYCFMYQSQNDTIIKTKNNHIIILKSGCLCYLQKVYIFRQNYYFPRFFFVLSCNLFCYFQSAQQAHCLNDTIFHLLCFFVHHWILSARKQYFSSKQFSSFVRQLFCLLTGINDYEIDKSLCSLITYILCKFIYEIGYPRSRYQFVARLHRGLTVVIIIFKLFHCFLTVFE